MEEAQEQVMASEEKEVVNTERKIVRRPRRKPMVKKKGKSIHALMSPDPSQGLGSVPEQPVKKATEPWRPASILTAYKKDGYRSRWCRKDILEKRMAEGWEPRKSTTKGRVEAPETTIVDGVSLGNFITKRNLVLCDMPEEMALSREEYFKNLTDGGLQSEVNQLKDKINISENKGSKVYGEIRVG
jgi:hypothetical protein